MRDRSRAGGRVVLVHSGRLAHRLAKRSQPGKERERAPGVVGSMSGDIQLKVAAALPGPRLVRPTLVIHVPYRCPRTRRRGRGNDRGRRPRRSRRAAPRPVSRTRRRRRKEDAKMRRRRDRGGPEGTRYTMREKVFSIGDDFWIETDGGERAFKVDGKALRIRQTLVVESRSGEELFTVQEQKLSVRDKMEVERGRARPWRRSRRRSSASATATRSRSRGVATCPRRATSSTTSTRSSATATRSRRSRSAGSASGTRTGSRSSRGRRRLILAVAVCIDQMGRGSPKPSQRRLHHQNSVGWGHRLLRRLGRRRRGSMPSAADPKSTTRSSRRSGRSPRTPSAP